MIVDDGMEWQRDGGMRNGKEKDEERQRERDRAKGV